MDKAKIEWHEMSRNRRRAVAGSCPTRPDDGRAERKIAMKKYAGSLLKASLPSIYQVKIAEDGKSLSVGGMVFYANDVNAVELLTPGGWKEVLLELDNKQGWIATTEEYSAEKGFYVDTLNVNPVGMFARIPRRRCYQEGG